MEDHNQANSDAGEANAGMDYLKHPLVILAGVQFLARIFGPLLALFVNTPIPDSSLLKLIGLWVPLFRFNYEQILRKGDEVAAARFLLTSDIRLFCFFSCIPTAIIAGHIIGSREPLKMSLPAFWGLVFFTLVSLANFIFPQGLPMPWLTPRHHVFSYDLICYCFLLFPAFVIGKALSSNCLRETQDY